MPRRRHSFAAVDNGDARPSTRSGTKFSRFAEFSLDTDKGVATLVWEFRPMLGSKDGKTPAYSFHAGSVYRLPNGNTVGAASCDNDQAGTDCTHIVYEADAKGDEVARVTVPNPSDSNPMAYAAWQLREMGGRPSRGGMGYRGLPLFSLGGEHAA